MKATPQNESMSTDLKKNSEGPGFFLKKLACSLKKQYFCQLKLVKYQGIEGENGLLRIGLVMRRRPQLIGYQHIAIAKIIILNTER